MVIKKIFNVATYKRDKFLYKTIESIYEQADIINIALNSHTKIPDNLKNDKKINCHITDNSIGDGFKFLKLGESDGYYFTIDDDIIYPSNYSDYLIEKSNKYNDEYIITLHGRTFLKYPINSYYRSEHRSYHCLNELKFDVISHFGGTGVMMFNTNLLKFSYKEILYPNMGDIWVSKFANERGIKIMCVEHGRDFLNYQKEIGSETIFDNYKFNDSLQTNLANTIKFNY